MIDYMDENIITMIWLADRLANNISREIFPSPDDMESDWKQLAWEELEKMQVQIYHILLRTFRYDD